MGEYVELPGGLGHIVFDSVLEDSRCPRGVQCVWPGNARILLRLVEGDRALAQLELNTHPERVVGIAWGALQLRLLELSPQPVAGRRHEPGDYTARLRVAALTDPAP